MGHSGQKCRTYALVKVIIYPPYCELVLFFIDFLTKKIKIKNVIREIALNK